MAEVTTKEMIALLNADIKFALEIGDKEFAGYLKEAKADLLDGWYPTRNEEYAELFGKQAIFCLTIYMPDGNIRYSEKQRGYA